MAKPVKCARCGRENDPSFSFCLDCGQPLKLPAAPPPAAEKTCLGCGARLPPGFRFCGHCGRPVEPAPAVTPVGRTPVHLGGTALAGEAPPAPARPGPPTPRHLPEPTGPRLSMVRYDGVVGQVFPLAHEATTCGRQAGEVLFPDDLTVSPRHCVFTLRDGRVRVEDLGSASGTFLRLRAPRPVQPGDEIRVGRQLLRLEPLPREVPPGDAVPWGSPDPGYRLRLAQLLEGGGVGEVFPLRAGENLLGREVGDVTFPSDRYVSGRHARLDVAEGSATLSDLGSSNGTFVKIAGAVELAPGDQVLVGLQLLRLEI
ncbi:MAG TPA: FHA domain-containing protein [Anaeromyxobacteraceae bacterium]|nr:FHA domain-containing protein [Anaeromyxobacteraceae bacterium]